MSPGQRIKGIPFVLFLFLLAHSMAHSQGSFKVPIYLKNKEIWVEVAKTPGERARGLMGRKVLGKDEGMLFIFE